MNEQGRQSAHDGCDPLSAGPEWAAATRQRLPPPAFLKILSFEEAAYLLGCAPSVVCRLVMETGELAAVRFTTSGERLGAFSPDDIHGVMDRVGEDGSITATVPASGNLIDPGWRDIKAGILRIDRTELDRFITMNTPAVALPEPVAPATMPNASPATTHGPVAPPVEAPQVASWTFIPSKRETGYGADLNALLQRRHKSGKPIPTAVEVIEIWKANLPRGFQLVGVNLEYCAKSGGRWKEIKVRSLSAAITHRTSA